MLQRTITALVAAASVALLAKPVSAQTETDQFEASIDVQQICDLEVTDLHFGLVVELNQAHTETATGAVICTAQVDGQISFDVGDGGGNFQSRTMANGGNTVSYNIYADQNFTGILGNGQNGTVTIPVAADEVEFTVYGRTEPNQNAAPGTYASTITATLTF